MTRYPAEYLLVHPLPPAPNFVGREAELHELRSFWQHGSRGVLALVGLGGAGKTAVAARFLEELIGADASQRPKGLFLWSFYQEPDAGRFLQEAYHYVAGGAAAAQSAKGIGLLHLLREALAAKGPHWFVLDGLERVQSQDDSSTGTYGQIEDPLLKSLLARIAEGIGQAVVLVTTRFPLTDLQDFLGRGYWHVDIGGLSRQAALTLLRHRGVKGADADLDRLIEDYGAHALTLDHLGGVIGQFLDGNPNRAPEVATLSNAGQDRQALRLVRLLRAYEDHLPAAELALLCRLCLLRRSATEERVFQFFLCSPPVHARTVREVADFILRFPGLDQHLGEGLVLDLARTFCQTLEEALCTTPIAGPEETFRSEIGVIAAKVLEMHEAGLEIDFGELARLYADPALDTPTDLLPLDGSDRTTLRLLYERYVRLSEHPHMPYQELDPALEQAFIESGFCRKAPPAVHVELTPSDVLEGRSQAKQRLRYLLGKHFALQRLRDLCRIYQRKWDLAGPLAALDAAGLRQALAALVARHLILREADGSFSVHPAVRDHFRRLATGLDQGAWHDLLREHLVSLVHRPGQRHPADPATLDLAEEAIHHALAAGQADEALSLYRDVLGGLRHLAWKLGEMTRGLRILRSFNPCPEAWDLAWYLRALGEFDQALACNALPYFRADILLLQGRLPQVAAAADSTRTPIAAFLMGRTTHLPADQLASAIPREQLLLYLGRLDRIWRASSLDSFYQEIGWEGDRARYRLLLAEAARRQGDSARCQRYLDAAAVWILHSGSVEHLCLLHLVRSRFARSFGSLGVANLAVTEGLHLAGQCGLGLYHVELLCEQAEIRVASGDSPAAEDAAREAWQRASSPECQFLWGAAQAGHLLGQTLAAQGRIPEARNVLQETVALRRRIGDPAAEATERLLKL